MVWETIDFKPIPLEIQKRIKPMNGLTRLPDLESHDARTYGRHLTQRGAAGLRRDFKPKPVLLLLVCLDLSPSNCECYIQI